jgi:hypothetical protein
MKPTLISTDNPQSRVLVLQGFWKKYCLTGGKCGDFFQNPQGLTLRDNRTRDYLRPLKSGLDEID